MRRIDRRKKWAEQELAMLRAEYPLTPTIELAAKLNRPKPSIVLKARTLGLERDHEYISAQHGPRRTIRPAIETNGELSHENIELWKSVQKTRAIARNNPSPLWRSNPIATPDELACQTPII